MTRPRRSLALVSALAFIAAAALACGDVSGGSSSVLSIQFDSLGAPSVVVGDSLRDTTGALVRPIVHAYNFSGGEILPSPVWFQSPDSGVSVDSATGIVVGDSLRTGARIIATVGGLQAVQKVDVTLRPDLIVAVDSLDSLTYSLIDSTKNFSPTLTVKVRHGVLPNDSAVRSYIVSFSIVSESDSNLAQLVNEGRRRSVIDTTDANGLAGRAIYLRPALITSVSGVDSIVVKASARYRGVLVTGSPVRLVLKVKPAGS
ncbi:MAG: hypothetical protein ACR2NS_08595 [Gemmatimonadaceae bacterium]